MTEYVVYTNEFKTGKKHKEPYSLGYLDIIEAESVSEVKRILKQRNDGDTPHSYDGEEFIIIARSNISKLKL